MSPQQLIPFPVTTLGTFESVDGERIHTFNEFMKELDIRHPQTTLTPKAMTSARFILASEEEIEIEEVMWLNGDQEKPFVQRHVGNIIRVEHPLPLEDGSKLSTSGIKIIRGKGELVFQALAHCMPGLMLQP